MSLFYDLNGRRHEISHDEVEAIERTGTPHRVQDYAAGMHGRGYVDVSAEVLSLSVRVMESRPGQTDPGASPPAKPKRNPMLGRWSGAHPFHVQDEPLGYRTACGTRGVPQSAVITEKAFRAVAGDFAVCMRCARIIADRESKRCRPAAVKVVRWTDEKRKALKYLRRSRGLIASDTKRAPKRNWLTGW